MESTEHPRTRIYAPAVLALFSVTAASAVLVAGFAWIMG